MKTLPILATRGIFEKRHSETKKPPLRESEKKKNVAPELE